VDKHIDKLEQRFMEKVNSLANLPVENAPAARPPSHRHSTLPAVSSASIIIVTKGCNVFE
jgi:hypothetical protein